jgi:hypothetical protein
MVTILQACYRAYRDLDAVMVEINPLVITGAGDLVALDAKMSFDTNALVPPPAGRRTARPQPGRPARKRPPATMACLRRPRRRHRLHHQRRGPCDGHDGHDQAGGGRACELPRHRRRRQPRAGRAAFRTVLADRNVSVILVNIFAGINRCDWVAEGRRAGLQGGWPDHSRRRPACRHQCRRGQAHHRRTSGLPLIICRHAGRGGRQGRRRPSRRKHRLRRGPMAILITEKTRVIVQGITGRIGQFHAADMIKHGTNVVGGVTPGKGGSRPTWTARSSTPSARRSRRRAPRRASSSCRRPSPPTRSWKRPMPASDRRLRDRRHPRAGHDEGQALPARYPEERKMRLIGPNCAGIISPARASWGSCRRTSTCPAASASSAAPARWAMRPRAR